MENSPAPPPKNDRPASIYQIPERWRSIFFSCHPSPDPQRLTEFLSPFCARYPQLELELGAGQGDFMVEWGKNNPNRGYIAIEKKWSRCRTMARKVQHYQFQNVVILQGTMETILPVGLRNLHFENIYMNYPDPWPKRKQNKRRTLRQPHFLATLASLLNPAATFTFVTDHLEYATELYHLALTREDLQPLFSPPFPEKIPGYPTTLFEKYAIRDGGRPHYVRFQKTKVG